MLAVAFIVVHDQDFQDGLRHVPIQFRQGSSTMRQ
jgi:hypothetical protein